LQDCPVCDQETLLAKHLDDFGIGIATGTCFVCGYYRSDALVDEESMRFMWFNKWEHE
jgi:C4-type Zn-finger protein